jgi:hypothetical protein
MGHKNGSKKKGAIFVPFFLFLKLNLYSKTIHKKFVCNG